MYQCLTSPTRNPVNLLRNKNGWPGYLMSRPHLIIHNAQIATMNPAQPQAAALACQAERILAVGEDAKVLSLAGPDTRIVDLQGAFVCPGLTDSHLHLTWWAESQSGRIVLLDNITSLAHALDKIRLKASELTEDQWLLGRGWDKNHWVEQRFPTASELDTVTGDRPAVLSSHDGHSTWVNTVAMRIAGITCNTPDPDGGRILRDASGHPTGVLQENAAEKIWAVLPEPSTQQMQADLKNACHQANSMGLVAVHHCETGEAMQPLINLHDAGELTLRVSRYVSATELDTLTTQGITSGAGDEYLRIAGVKAFLDGALGGQTAAMFEPYQGTENTGVLTMSPDELVRLIHQATQAQLAVALHAIGDRAVHEALNAFEEVKRTWSGPWPRHRIEHAQHIQPADIPRFAQLCVIASMQPVHMLADIATCERTLDRRCKDAFPLQALLNSGAEITLGSDTPVEVIDPLTGMKAAILRQDHTGWPAEGWYPQQCLTSYQALHGYTLTAARAAGEEKYRGSLETKKLADFVVFSHNLLTIKPEYLTKVETVATVMAGNPVWDSRNLFS
jgi:predicted amidohydrolase YtcJ